MSRLASGCMLLAACLASLLLLAAAHGAGNGTNIKGFREALIQTGPDLATEFAEYTRLLLGDGKKAEMWLQQHAPTRLAAWRDAANGGSAEAMVLLGGCLNYGKGLPKDDGQAVKWYRKAAEKSNSWAQFSLGIVYIDGLGVLIDDEEAVKWFCKAAE
jgi:Sel1 repeat